MLSIFAVAVVLAVIVALWRLSRDDTAAHRLRRSENRALVKHLWYQ
jgi:hypothetical protein